jgi:hypothetical protein
MEWGGIVFASSAEYIDLELIEYGEVIHIID